MPKKILTILGARPQFVKAAVLSKAMRQYSDLQEVLVHTGQHYDHAMSGSFFQELGLQEPEYNLAVQRPSNQLAVADMLTGLAEVFNREKPDLVLIYGDTNSTLAGALAAKFHNTTLAHVEAGMRIGDLTVPEELNRVVSDRLSDLLFCSSKDAMANLEKEGISNATARVYFSGDLMYDSFITEEKAAAGRNFLLPEEMKSKYVLASLHRAETVDDRNRLTHAINAMNSINRSVSVVVPLHPRTRKRIQEFNLKPEFRILDAVAYPDMLNLLRYSSLVMTDSGGLQKEAFFSSKPCIVLREQTEWTELVRDGYVITTGQDEDKIISAFEKMSKSRLTFGEKYFGNGNSGELIAAELNTFLHSGQSNK